MKLPFNPPFGPMEFLMIESRLPVVQSVAVEIIYKEIL
jgi:hypothetical protein